ncbi:TPA: hypothetical protein DIC20_03150 [Candidatus Dependentiae bacterium]|nr:MAG: hypothetical protein US03_C0001G0020 [candidate division TM6 bacterium GW2011_GWF2_36_131]KKQ03844.1 MAG: hypothetical protein US13_C0001G0184 [candidate division TM6 bacterium GW2011_GWE2_36_25]KKQ19447.1 MAG: hypothetical protein US32_C0009G0019 [candidate division TM6 bacterium GW2011_GWA2_36_9]HBR70612.1 hypothetical protein [Candidatus Dependentiae bacterium]HCU00673.1 hypothetical protein [Candidatus Dependentiae bacterium]
MLSIKQQLFLCLVFVSATRAAQSNISSVADKGQNISASAEKTVKAPEVKAPNILIILVDIQDIINKTQVDKEFVEDLINKQQEFQKELKAKGEEIQKKEQNLKAKASALSADALKKLYEELDDIRVQANRLAERRQKELQQEEMNTRFKVFKTIQDYAQELLKNKPGVKVILEKNSVLAFDHSIDMTDELTKVIKDDLAKKEAAKKKVAAAKKETESAPKTSKLAASAAA